MNKSIYIYIHITHTHIYIHIYIYRYFCMCASFPNIFSNLRSQRLWRRECCKVSRPWVRTARACGVPQGPKGTLGGWQCQGGLMGDGGEWKLENGDILGIAMMLNIAKLWSITGLTWNWDMAWCETMLDIARLWCWKQWKWSNSRA